MNKQDDFDKYDSLEDLCITDEKWEPKAGQSFERLNPDTGNWEDGYVLTAGDLLLLVVIRSREQAVRKSSEFRPIKSPEDKYREEQIKRLDELQLGAMTATSGARYLYSKGVRVLTPDEFVAKRLTDAQIERIVNRNSHATAGGWRVDGEAIARAIQEAIARAVQNAMLGGEK